MSKKPGRPKSESQIMPPISVRFPEVVYRALEDMGKSQYKSIATITKEIVINHLKSQKQIP
mgnify:CR=1 FL=1